MRVFKIMMVTSLALALAATAAFAGGAGCTTKAASAASAGTCTAKSVAACGASMAGTKVEATRLTSGDLVVHYVGTTPDAVKFLHAKAEGSPDKFCCGMTQKMASNEKCKVDMAKVSNGVIVFVSSANKDVVDQYEKEFAALTTK